MRGKFKVLFALSAMLALAVLAGGACRAAVKEPAWKKLDVNTLVSLLSKGDLVSVEQIGGGTELSTIGTIVNAPPEKVFATFTDFKNYPKMIPSCTSTKVSQQTANSAVVRFAVQVIKVGPVDITADYTLKYVMAKPKRADISWVSGTVKNVQGYWETIPVPGGKKTILVYAITSNLKEANAFAKSAFEKQPSTETAINLSSAIVLIKAIKKKAESK